MESRNYLTFCKFGISTALTSRLGSPWRWDYVDVECRASNEVLSQPDVSWWWRIPSSGGRDENPHRQTTQSASHNVRIVSAGSSVLIIEERRGGVRSVLSPRTLHLSLLCPRSRQTFFANCWLPARPDHLLISNLTPDQYFLRLNHLTCGHILTNSSFTL